MSISVNKSHAVKKKEKANNVSNTQVKPREVVFDIQLTPPSDSFLSQKLINENIKSIMYSVSTEVGIKNYTPTLVKDDNTMIAKSQAHLIDMLKYYEGDNHYYYEAKTTGYVDKYGTYTTGFGKTRQKTPMTQDKAYETLAKDIKEHAKYVENKVGKDTYKDLPSSVKEALIDLSFNKGPNKITSEMVKALKSKDYAKAIPMLQYLYSGDDEKKSEKDPGLYRRSLSRMILATRDLSSKQKEALKPVITKFYQEAKNYSQGKGASSVDLDKIYEQYSKGCISAKPINVANYKLKVDERFSGMGFNAIVRSAYNSDENAKDLISCDDYIKLAQGLNKDYANIKKGQEIYLPMLDSSSELPEKPQEVQPQPEEESETTEEVETEEVVSDKKEEEVAEEEESSGTFKNVLKTAAYVTGGVGLTYLAAKNPKATKTVARGLFKGLKTAFSLAGKFFKFLGPKGTIGLLATGGAYALGKWVYNKFTGKKEEQQTVNPTYMNDIMRTPGAKIEDAAGLKKITIDYTLEEGENFLSVAEKYRIPESFLRKLNNVKNITDKKNFTTGSQLQIQKLGYEVNEGDTYDSIAEKLGLTPEYLKAVNDGVELKQGAILDIPGIIYNVQSGDTLSKIALKTGISVEQLKAMNGLTSDKLSLGQELKVLFTDAEKAVTIKERDIFENRELIRQPMYIDGKVVATRKVFEPTNLNGPLAGKTIIINAGHGYKDQDVIDEGTAGRGGLDPEWLINYDNSMRLVQRLQAKGAKVIFLQGHVDPIMEEMKKKRNNADLFVSVHVNSSETPTKDRTQVYYYRKENQDKKTKKTTVETSQSGKKLADIMEGRFDKWIPENETIGEDEKFMRNVSIPSGEKIRVQDYAQSEGKNLAVLREANGKNMPAVLWEIGFMISPKGRERMSNPSLMKSYSDIMTESIVEYLN